MDQVWIRYGLQFSMQRACNAGVANQQPGFKNKFLFHLACIVILPIK
jgi:hypothetical protein